MIKIQIGHENLQIPLDPKKDRTFRDNLIKDIASTSFKELATSFAITAVTCMFVAVPAVPLLVQTAVAAVFVNTLLRGYAGICLWQLRETAKIAQSHPNHVVRQNAKNKIHNLSIKIELIQSICPIYFALLNQCGFDILVHELGHAFAAKQLYQNASAKVSVFPFKGGVCSAISQKLSPLGTKYGSKISRLLFTAAGPAAGVLYGTSLIGLGHCLQKDHPLLSNYFLYSGVLNIIQHVTYATSALIPKCQKPGHDFVHLWKVGNIHPVVSIAYMVALPIIVKTTLFAMDHMKS